MLNKMKKELSKLIKKNRNLSKKWKKLLLKCLKNNYELKGFDTKKDLFYSMMEARIYDIYTSSLLTLFFNNPISLNTLTRGQLENLGLLQYLFDNKNKFNDFFKKKLNVNYPKEVKKVRPDLAEWWGRTSDYVHPLPEGLKIILTDMSQMIPKDPTKDYRKVKKINIEEFKLIPSIGKQATPHTKIKKEDFDIIAHHTLALYVACTEKLRELYKILPEDKVDNLQEFWKKYNKKNSL